MVQELIDNYFKVEVKVGDYNINIEISIEKNKPFNIKDIKDILLSMESYSKNELGLIITTLMIEDSINTLHWNYYNNIELLPNVETECIYMNFKKQLL
jgi:hypothetical protein